MDQIINKLMAELAKIEGITFKKDGNKISGRSEKCIIFQMNFSSFASCHLALQMTESYDIRLVQAISVAFGKLPAFSHKGLATRMVTAEWFINDAEIDSPRCGHCIPIDKISLDPLPVNNS